MSCGSKAESFISSLIGNEKLYLKPCKNLFRVIYWWNCEPWVQPTDFICCRNATGREKSSLSGYNVSSRYVFLDGYSIGQGISWILEPGSLFPCSQNKTSIRACPELIQFFAKCFTNIHFSNYPTPYYFSQVIYSPYILNSTSISMSSFSQCTLPVYKWAVLFLLFFLFMF
jgi:hypothetical protein